MEQLWIKITIIRSPLPIVLIESVDRKNQAEGAHDETYSTGNSRLCIDLYISGL